MEVDKKAEVLFCLLGVALKIEDKKFVDVSAEVGPNDRSSSDFGVAVVANKAVVSEGRAKETKDEDVGSEIDAANDGAEETVFSDVSVANIEVESDETVDRDGV